jgi:hypothetical protein
MNFETKVLKWILHTLTSDLKMIRIDMCLNLLVYLKIQQWINWRNIVTGDENWFYCEYYCDQL